MKNNAGVRFYLARNLIVAAFAAGIVSVEMTDVVFGSAAASTGCGSSQKTATTVIDSGALAICVLQHSTDPVSKIVEQCAGATETLVTTLLSEHKSASVREESAKLRDGGK
jgi:hypothetical protein